ncbi:MAG: hypothetical protein Fur0034_15530 [Desulfuromonadia bacterium]
MPKNPPNIISPREHTISLAVVGDDEKPDSDTKSPHPLPGADTPQIVVTVHPGGQSAAYIARTGNTVHVTFNGVRGKSFDGIDPTTLVLSPDGKHVAYTAMRGDRWFVVVNTREYGPFLDKGPPVFSPDSSHVAFEVRDEKGWHIVSDSGVSPAIRHEFTGPPIFSADSRKIARFERTPDGSHDRIVISDLSFGTLAEHDLDPVGFVDDPSHQRVVFVDQLGPVRQLRWVFFQFPSQIQKGAIFDEIYYPRVSGDGKTIAFLGRRRGAKFVGLDSREEKLPEGGTPLSPFITQFGTAAVVIEGLNGTYVHHAFSDAKLPVPGKYRECNDVVFTPDGKNHAYVAIKNDRFILVCNGIEHEGYDRVIGPRFTPDGRYLVYRARKGNKRFAVLADPKTNRVLREFSHYDRVFDFVFLDGGRSIGYGAIDGKSILWKVEALQ